MKFLKADYLGDGQEANMTGSKKGTSSKAMGKEIAKKIDELTDKERKMQRELDKIRMLDAQLA